MNEYIFYTTEGYTHPPNESKEVENCQVLGFATGNNAKEAKENLIRENPWIIECGFNPDTALCRRLYTADTL